MKVKAYKGTKNLKYTLIVPANSSSLALAADEQKKIADNMGGPLKEIKQFDLDPTKSPLHKETIEEFAKKGYHIWQTEVQFTEQVVRQPPK